MTRTLSLAFFILTLAACSSSPAPGNDAAGPGNDAFVGHDSGPTGATLDCASYCAASLANCASMEPQYTNMAACMGACSALTVGVMGDTSGNTLACRVYHVNAAASMPGMEHCLHSGPAGYAVCGMNQCEPFCQIALHNCPAIWTSLASCMTDCATMAGSTPDMPAGAPDYSTSQTSGNTFACRMYHLTVASSSTVMATAHCPHIALISTQCN